MLYDTKDATRWLYQTAVQLLIVTAFDILACKAEASRMFATHPHGYVHTRELFRPAL